MACTKSKIFWCLKSNLLTILTLCGVMFGTILGIVLKSGSENTWTERNIMYINFIGEIYLRLLKSLILPLIISSLISAISQLDLSLSKKVALRAVLFYLITTFCAVILGIVLVVIIKPGKTNIESITTTGSQIKNITTADTLLDLIRNIFPSNIVEACTKQTRTSLKSPINKTVAILNWPITIKTVEGINILGLIMISSLFGVALATLEEEGKPMAKFFISMASATMVITTWVIWLSPVGILFLISSKILEIENLGQLIQSLGLYFSTVMAGLFIQGFIIIPLIYFVFTRKNPFVYMANLAQAMATAFGTASSSASLPVTITCLEKGGVDSNIARFCLPIGATINMDGTALYEAVAAIYISQMRNIDLEISDLLAVSIMATMASIGAAGIPQAGLVTMVIVLNTVGLPAEDISLIIAIDWLLDRFRTTVNVMGDAFGAGIVAHWSKNELKKLNAERP